MNKCEFMSILYDFDGFMRSNGYVKVSELAKMYDLQPVTIRGWITAGYVKFPDVVTIGNVNYISKDIDKPTKNRSKERKGRFYYGKLFCGKETKHETVLANGTCTR